MRGRGRRPVCPGLAADTHTWLCLASSHRCLQLLVLCCQTQVGALPHQLLLTLLPHPKGQGAVSFRCTEAGLASLMFEGLSLWRG